MSDFDDELTALFHDESTERLNQMDAALLAIESGEADAATVDELFRNAHTIKGGAGILGYDDVRELAHAVEDVLARMRENGTFPPHTAPPLLRATEALRAMVMGNGEPMAGLFEELAACAAALAVGEAIPEQFAAGAATARPEAARAEAPSTAAASTSVASTSVASTSVASTSVASTGPADAVPAGAGTSRAAVSVAGDGPAASDPGAVQGPAVLAGIPDPRPSPNAGAARQAPQRPGTDRRAVRVPAEKIDHLLDVVGEVMQERQRLIHSLGEEASLTPELADQLTAGDRMLGDLKDSAVGLRTLPLGAITGPLPRAVRDLAHGVGKQVEFVVTGTETELDRVILESLTEPLTHLLRNCVIHGIEPPAERERAGKAPGGRIELRAIPRGRLVEIVVSDDGRGITANVIEQARQSGSLAELLARPGYSTAGQVTDLAGRGVGLDAVKTQVQSLGGSFEVRSEPGKGMEVVLLLPLALALLDVLLFERSGAVFGVPLAAVEEVVHAAPILVLEGRPSLDIRGRPLPVRDIASLVGATVTPLGASPPGLVLAAGGRRVIVTCDELLGEQEVVVKSLGPLLSLTVGYLGAAILGDGRIALLLEPATLIRGFQSATGQPSAAAAAVQPDAPAKILVVEDSFTVRELQRSILEAVGYQVVTAKDGLEGLRALERESDVALVLSDFEMPGMDGLEMTRTIRADPAHSSLPVVIITSRASEEDRHRGIEAGADAYMAKQGYDQHALLATVERLIGK